MVCEKCNESGVYNEVAGKGFYYCRNCKIEIELQAVDTQKYVELDTSTDQFSWWDAEDEAKYKALTKGLRLDYFCF